MLVLRQNFKVPYEVYVKWHCGCDRRLFDERLEFDRTVARQAQEDHCEELRHQLVYERYQQIHANAD